MEMIEVYTCPKCSKIEHHHVWKKNEGDLQTHLKNNKERWRSVVKVCPDCRENN
jgi:ssDNA-binding Zn-finger/Zn-ribbon topoisomerase 1